MKKIGTKIMMVRGDTEHLTVTMRDKTTKAQIPFEDGDIVRLTVKKNSRLTEKVFQIVVDAFVDGSALITILPDDTKELEFRDYMYDIQVTKANGDIHTLVWADTFTVAEEITDE